MMSKPAASTTMNTIRSFSMKVSFVFAAFVLAAASAQAAEVKAYDFIACGTAGIQVVIDLNDSTATWITDGDVENKSDPEKVTITAIPDPKNPSFDSYLITSATKQVAFRFLDGDQVGEGRYKLNSSKDVIRMSRCLRDMDDNG